jgi:hypothetical protein
MRILLAIAAVVASPPNVTKMVLTPAQVGQGYVLLQRRDGVGVKNTITLDLCGRAGYPSEKLRTARLQVNYLKRNTALGLSNEVVAYKPGGAAQAMAEVTRRAGSCPAGPIVTGDPTLPPLRFTITRIKVSNLLPGYLAVRVRVRGVINGKARDETSYAVYQRLGNVLSGTYSFGPNTDAQLRFVLHAAQQSALNLRRGGAAGGPTA